MCRLAFSRSEGLLFFPGSALAAGHVGAGAKFDAYSLSDALEDRGEIITRDQSARWTGQVELFEVAVTVISRRISGQRSWAPSVLGLPRVMGLWPVEQMIRSSL